MTTQRTSDSATNNSATISLDSAAALAASIPYLLGFYPSKSLVGVFLSTTGRVVVSARVDLDVTDGSEQAVVGWRQCCHRAQSQGATAVLLAAYPHPDDVYSQVAGKVHSVIADSLDAGITVLDSGLVTESGWCSIDDAGTVRAASPQGKSAALKAECEWVARGVGFVPSREDVARRVSPEDTELARAAASLFRGGRPVSVIRSSKRRRRTEDTLYRFATTRHRSGSAEIMTAPLLVHSAKALHDRRIREPLLWRLARWLEPADEARRRHAVDGLCLMTRSCPPPLIAPVASCTAAVAWQVGDGALARLAAERGLAESPDNVLCRLVLDAVSAGIPPKVWVEMLANFSVASLRNPPSDRR